jgi:general secretion pathway protein A
VYLNFFGLKESPFAITPDPAFVYLSAAHREALAHLMYGVGQGGAGGFVQLTGEVGTGKTTLCRCLLDQVPEETQVALVLNPLMTPRELLATICEELGIDTAGMAESSKRMVDALNGYLLKQHAAGSRVVVVIDEAQNLSPEALEQVRLLTNLETAKEKLLQMVLLGQPELRQLLQRQSLRQLSQRITARYHLAPLNQDETHGYVRHRMQVAGAQRNPFRRAAMRALYRRSGGVPRLINIIADRALAGAYARESDTVTARLVHAAADEVQPSETRVRSGPWPMAVATSSVAALVIVSLLLWGPPLFERGGPDADPTPIVAARGAGASSGPPDEPQPSAAAGTAAGPAVSEPVEVAGRESEPVGPALEPLWFSERDRESWQAMAELWGDAGDANAVQASCDGAAGTGYACLRDQGNWERIRQLGLPVILVLQLDQPSHLLLRGFSESGVLVGRGGAPLEVPRREIERKWLGEYIVVWPQAPGWPKEIQRGESGVAVDIVMRMAGFAEPAWTGSGMFDASFESWLMGFQRRHGLKADGIVGPNTLIHLMAPTISQPRLILSGNGDA